MIETLGGVDFIDATLRGSATFMEAVSGGLWHAMRTDLPEVGFPEDVYCVYQYLAGHDDLGGGGVRIGSNDLFLAKVIGPASHTAAIKTAADLMDGLLHGASGTTSDTTVYYLLRQADFMLSEIVNATLVLSIGGQYRMFVQKTGS